MYEVGICILKFRLVVVVMLIWFGLGMRVEMDGLVCFYKLILKLWRGCIGMVMGGKVR